MDLESLLTRQDIPKDVKKIIENNFAEFKKKESNYRSNEALLRTLLNVSPDASILLDKEGIILEINNNATRRLGKTIDEIIGRCLFDFLQPDIASIGKVRFKEVINSKKPIQFKSKKDGRIFDYILYPVLNENNQINKIAWFSSGSTDRKRAKNEEREALKIYQRIIEQMEESVSVEDAEGIITFVNPRYLEMSGFKENELVGKHWSVTVPPEDLEQVKTESRKRPKGISSTYESTTLTRNGSVIPIIVTSNPFFSNNGVFAGVLSVFTDITKRKKIEEKLQESRELYQRLVDQMAEGVIVEDVKGIITFVNPKHLEITGFSEDELLGKHWSIMVPSEKLDEVRTETNKRPKGISSSYESSIKTKRGSITPIHVTASPFFSKTGEFEGVLSVFTDITNRKKIEQELQESKELYQRLVEQMAEGVVVEDVKGIITFANPKYMEISGYTKEEVIGKHGISMVPPDYLEDCLKHSAKRPGGVSSTYENALLQKDGSIVPIMVSAGPLFSKRGKFEGVLALITDITEKKEVEKQLIKAKEKYQLLVEKMEEGVLVEDVEGNISFVNPKAAKLLGHTPEELMGKDHTFTVAPEYHEIATSEADKRPKGITSAYESCLIAKDGKRVPILTSATPLFSKSGEFDGVLVVFNDITNQKNVEKELREARDKYQLLVEKLNEGVILENEEGILSFVNPRLLEMHGYSEDEVIGKHWKILVAPEDQKNVQAQTDKRQEGIVSHYESDGRKKDGSIFPVSVTSTPIFSDDGEYKGVLSVVVDITDRKQAEEALKESKEKYQLLVEKLNEGVILEDREGYYKFVNPKTAQLVGYTEEELIGKHWTDTIAESHVDIVKEEYSKRPKGVSSTYEAYVQTKDGRPIPVIISATPIFTKTGEFNGVLAIFTDISIQKEVEHELRKSEEKYHMLVEKLEEALMVEDSEGKITFVNPKTVEMLGYSEEEIIGKHWSTLITEGFVDIGYKETAKHMKGISSIYESSLKSRDGIGIPVIITATPIFSSSGEFDGVIALATNITERKQVEQKLIQVKQQEERYHAMLSHFINNDMQKIINNLELLSLMYESDLGIDHNIVDKAITIASGSSKTIDAVNKIFAILQSTFIIPDKGFNLLNILNEVITELSKDPSFFEIDKKELNVELQIDSNFKDVLRGLFLFVFSSKDVTPETKIDIQGSFFPSYYSIIISDNCSEPLSNDIISKLSGNITDEWEVIGHNIDIALTSVIMKHYGGSLIIKSLTHKGNEFQLLFPLDIVKPPNEIENY